MTAFWKKYFALRQRNARIAWDRAKHMKFCYAFLAPYALLFLTFYILPMLISTTTPSPTTTFWSPRASSGWATTSP